MKEEILYRYCDRLDEMLRYFMRKMHQELAETLERGITGNQFILMKIIHDQGRMTVSAVAEELCVSLSAVTSLVDRLCKVGVMVRRRSEEDRRVVWLELTNEGASLVNDCQAGRRRVINRYLGQLKEDDLISLISIYEKVIAIMKQDEKEELNNACGRSENHNGG